MTPGPGQSADSHTDSSALTPAALADFVRRRAALEKAASEGLGLRERVDEGLAIVGARIAQWSGKTLQFDCPANISRIRAGDAVVLECGAQRLQGTVLELSGYGQKCVVETSRQTSSLPRAAWAITQVPIDLSELELRAIDKLKPGSPGWWWARALLEPGCRLPAEHWCDHQRARVLLQELNQATERPLDESQSEAFVNCVTQPAAFAVQGPPGTGKTVLLAYVAEALARLGRRVLIVSPTHQAVNNALSTIRARFPERQLAKAGDEMRRESLSGGIGVARFSREMASSQIIGMTFASAITQLVVRSGAFAPHVVLVDEAGQLPLHQGLVTGLLGAASILLFGDDMQMPPVFLSELASDPAATSVFARFHRLHASATRMLEVSYRLNAELCKVIGRTFYAQGGASALRPSHEASARVFPPVQLPADPPSLVRDALDPARSLVWLETTIATEGQTNRQEAERAADIVFACLRGGLAVDDIAVVTPYRRQAMLIRDTLRERLGTLALGLPIVDTVERVQGLTVEAIVVSLCAEPVAKPDHRSLFALSPNRLNVALSRGRTKAILLSAVRLDRVVSIRSEGPGSDAPTSS